MRRRTTRARPGYLAKVNAAGVVYTHENPVSESPQLYKYWRDDAYYEMTKADVAALEEASAVLFEMLGEAGDWLLSPAGAPTLARFGIPAFAMRSVIASWNEEPACGSVYGRFDLRFGGVTNLDPALSVPKLYEFNADTPTSLVESLAQWGWFEDNAHLGDTQWTNMFEDLVAAWRRNLAIIEQKLGHRPVVYFACTGEDASHEDEMNTLVMRDTCAAAGYDTATVYIESLWIGEDGRYYAGQTGPHIEVVFKLYPWEHMAHSENAVDLFADIDRSGLGGAPYAGGTIWIEAPYKMLWSTKAILPVLWKLFGTDPARSKYLIPSWFEDEAPLRTLRDGHVRKPILSREGADITITLPRGKEILGEMQGYGSEGFVVQALALPPVFHRDEEDIDVSTVIGVWMVDGEPSGLAIRESRGPITDNFANFIPHVVRG